MREVRIKNFKEGMRVDNIDEDANQIQSLLLLENADIDWRTGAGVRRKGYEYFYDSLPYDAKQIYEFVNTAGTATMLVVMNDKLYYIKAGVPTAITNDSYAVPALSFASYDYYPFVTVLNRCFFADDNDLYWLDSTSLSGDVCYQLGITAPIFATTPDVSNAQDKFYSLPSHQDVINPSGMAYYAQSFTLARDTLIDAIQIQTLVTGSPSDNIDMIVSLRSDNAGNPGTIVSTGTRSLISINPVTGAHNLGMFSLDEKVAGVTGNTYWIVVNCNIPYAGWYSAGVTQVAVDSRNIAPTGVYKWSTLGTAWVTIVGRSMLYIIGGGLDEGSKYNYAFTYVNNQYNSESAPRYIEDVIPEKATTLFTGMDLTTTDNQVDVVRLYRTKAIDDTVYYYITELATTDTTFWDNIDDENLGTEMQCIDHQRSEICPVRQITHWHNRIYISSDDDTNNHILYYSKILESNGLTGIAGDPSYDYFPQQTSEYGHLYGNDLALEAPITAIGRQGATSDVANDISSMLVVITSNDVIHTFTGGFDPQNPPQDLIHNPIVLDEGIIESRTMKNFKGRLVFLNNNKELKAYNGSIDLEDLTDDIQSLLDGVGVVYHAEAYNNRLWLLVDDDSDDVMDTVYLINLQRRDKVIYHKYIYKHDDNEATIYDIHKGQSALYALLKDALSTYHIVELESGTSDSWEVSENDGTEIVMKLQSHYIRPARRAYWQEVGIRGYYPTSTIPTLTTTCTDLSARTTAFTLNPSGTEDEDGHKHGLVMASQELSFLIQSTGAEADEIREMFIRYRLEGE